MVHGGSRVGEEARCHGLMFDGECEEVVEVMVVLLAEKEVAGERERKGGKNRLAINR